MTLFTAVLRDVRWTPRVGHTLNEVNKGIRYGRVVFHAGPRAVGVPNVSAGLSCPSCSGTRVTGMTGTGRQPGRRPAGADRRPSAQGPPGRCGMSTGGRRRPARALDGGAARDAQGAPFAFGPTGGFSAPSLCELFRRLRCAGARLAARRVDPRRRGWRCSRPLSKSANRAGPGVGRSNSSANSKGTKAYLLPPSSLGSSRPAINVNPAWSRGTEHAFG